MNKVTTPSVFHLLIGILLTAIPVKSWSMPELSFLKEDITFTICAPDTIEILGIYWFSNTGDESVTTTIFYPFPLDSNAAFPHYIDVKRYDSRKAIAYRQLTNGIEWRQTVPARGLDSVLVVYRQKVKKGIGQYIVSTTKLWDKPLQKADFKVRVPPNTLMTFWTFQTDSMCTNNDTLIYYSQFKSFMPDEEMNVRWH
jgi:hypothetical protein